MLHSLCGCSACRVGPKQGTLMHDASRMYLWMLRGLSSSLDSTFTLLLSCDGNTQFLLGNTLSSAILSVSLPLQGSVLALLPRHTSSALVGSWEITAGLLVSGFGCIASPVRSAVPDGEPLSSGSVCSRTWPSGSPSPAAGPRGAASGAAAHLPAPCSIVRVPLSSRSQAALRFHLVSTIAGLGPSCSSLL